MEAESSRGAPGAPASAGLLLCQAVVSLNEDLLCLLRKGFSAEIWVVIFYLPQTETTRKA